MASEYPAGLFTPQAEDYIWNDFKEAKGRGEESSMLTCSLMILAFLGEPKWPSTGRFYEPVAIARREVPRDEWDGLFRDMFAPEALAAIYHQLMQAPDFAAAKLVARDLIFHAPNLVPIH